MYTRHAPGFLLATPSLVDPIFKQALVLLFHHDDGGASGLVFNRPSDQPVGDLLSSIGLTPRDERMASMLVGFGGPVAPGIGWVVYEGSEGREESFSLADDLQVSGSRTVLERLLKHDPALRMRFVLGYAGWAYRRLTHIFSAWPAPGSPCRSIARSCSSPPLSKDGRRPTPSSASIPGCGPPPWATADIL